MLYTDEVHLIGDTLQELHDFAKFVGLKREWFQDHPRHPHYDITTSRMLRKILAGPVTRISSKQLLKKIEGETNMYGKQLSNARYKRCLELFAAVYEELGEAQKAFNDYAWKNSKKYGKIVEELQQVASPLLELIDTLKKAPICHSMRTEKEE